ncbi:MAG TPA: DUF5916 domain-containing protein, partial [Rhodothermales bacterium]
MSAARLISAVFGVLVAAFPFVRATAQDVFEIPRLTAPITFDGRVDEEAWQQIPPLPLLTEMPTFGNQPSDPTELRVAYDDAYLYLAARCYADSDGVFAPSFKRDIFTTGTDYVGLTLDTFDDDQNALNFSVTPTGARLDYAVSNDAQGDAPASPSWNAFWDAVTVKSEEGWFAELRIPFSSLRFQDDDGRVEMGLIAFRWMARRSEMVTFPPIEPRWGFWSFAKPSQARTAVIEGVRSRRPLYITPYALAGAEHVNELNDAETAYRTIDDPAYDVGLDLKYGLTSNLTLDLTANTDFAQVEADVLQVNLTRFSLFFPEQRLFFQERASIFDFGMSEPASVMERSSFSATRLFYSRRIGLHEGQPVRIFGGGRIVGRFGGWDVGMIDMQTAREPHLLDDGGALPSENFGVLRLRRQVFNANSFAGVMATNRIAVGGQRNSAYGFDGLFRLFGEDYLSLDWSQTFDDTTHAASLFDNARIQARWERRRYSGFGYSFSASRSGANYLPGLGFQLREDYTRIGDRIFYGWTPGAGSWLQSHQVSLKGAAFIRNSDGTVESAEAGPSWGAFLKSGVELYFTGVMSYEDVREEFELASDAVVPPGRYRFFNLRAEFDPPGGRSLRTFLFGSAGTFYDGTRISGGIFPIWIVSPHLELSTFFGLDRVDFPDRDQAFTARLARFRVQAALNTKLSASAFVQYSSAADALITNVRLRYNPREGVDLYLVYNEGLNTDRFREDPTLPLTS